eukprot:5648819-Pleurochrysis_carterae.AAC.1
MPDRFKVMSVLYYKAHQVSAEKLRPCWKWAEAVRPTRRRARRLSQRGSAFTAGFGFRSVDRLQERGARDREVWLGYCRVQEMARVRAGAPG